MFMFVRPMGIYRHNAFKMPVWECYIFAMQTHREDQFQNDDVKVWRTTVLPNQPLAMHHHDHPRVLVALTDGTMDIVDSNGTHDVHVWKQNHAYWLPAMPPGALHSDVNVGTSPLEVLVVELQKEN